MPNLQLSATEVQAQSATGRHATSVGLAALIALQVVAILGGHFYPSDFFHLGEFVGAATSILSGEPAHAYPFTLHGAGDYLPAIALERLGPADVPASAIFVAYRVLAALSFLLAVLTLDRLARNLRTNRLLFLPFLLFVPAALTFRDTIFCLSLFLFTRVASRDASPRRLIGFELGLGAALALGLFWSFDRGAMTLVAIGLPLFVLAGIKRRHRVAVLSFLGSALLLGSLLPGMSLGHYLENFRFVFETAENWRYPWNAETKLLTSVAVISVSISSWLVVRYLMRQRPPLEQGAQMVALVLASLIYLKIGTNRAGVEHVVWSLWLPLLAAPLTVRQPTSPRFDLWKPAGLVFVASIIATECWILRSQEIPPVFWTPLAFALLSMMCFLVIGTDAPGWVARLAVTAGAGLCGGMLTAATSLIGFDYVGGQYDWISQLPDDAEALSDRGARWSAEELVAAQAPCAFDLTNNGIINWLAKLPACSPFVYPVYAGPQQEQVLIDGLLSQAPPVIVYSADFWAYSIDGIPMTARFPRLDEEIIRIYPNVECKDGYCIRSRPAS